MTDHGKTFTAEMVRALLSGRKAQTRRLLIKPKWAQDPGWPEAVMDQQDLDGRLSWYDAEHGHLRLLPIPQIGDRIYVREHWKTDRAYDDLPPRDMGGNEPLIYLADDTVERWGWKPDALSRWGRHRQAMHMPRWASRITLHVKDVRVERLQDISEADAKAEGAKPDRHGGGMAGMYMARGIDPHAYARGFRDLWNSIHGPEAWSANPWVYALTFDVQRGNIDAEGGA